MVTVTNARREFFFFFQGRTCAYGRYALGIQYAL